MLTESTVLEALRAVIDPEIGINVVDLGMIRQVVIRGGSVEVKMVLTAPFCPLASFISGQVQQVVSAIQGVQEAEVTLLDEPWDPSWVKRPT